MKKMLMLLCAVILGISAANAQNEWVDSPGKYVAANTKIIVSRTSPCNQGEEAFMDFIPKFRADAKFRESRARFSSEDEYSKTCFDNFENWYLFKAQQKRLKDEAWYSTWYGIAENQVCLEFSEWTTDPNAEWGGSGMYARFQRIDGKWYMTGFMLAG